VVAREFANAIGCCDGALSGLVTALAGAGAAMHLFRVCCGLESLVLGEAEILGQVRTALEGSTHAGAFLTGVIRAALRAGGAARAETTIGFGAMSVASMAVQWLSRTLSLKGRRVLIIGAGETGQKLARKMRSMQLAGLEIANRTHARAADVAATIGGRAIGLENLGEAIGRADAVICAAGGSEWIVRREDLQAASNRTVPLHVIDIAMPAGIEPGDVPGVRRMDLAGLQDLVADYRRQREAEIPRVEAVITRELSWLQAWAHRHAMRPVLRRFFTAEAP
jgi:glutamyl-tRNA reductase